MASMDDVEIRETVESILGQRIRVLDVEKTTTSRNEETLLINGTPVPLTGAAGDVIRQALLRGVAPPSDVLNQLLVSAGIWRAPVRLHTTLTTNTTTLNKDVVVVRRHGVVVDERVKETRHQDSVRKTSTELWRLAAAGGFRPDDDDVTPEAPPPPMTSPGEATPLATPLATPIDDVSPPPPD